MACRGAASGEGLGNAFLSHITAVDGILHVCRGFEVLVVACFGFQAPAVCARNAMMQQRTALQACLQHVIHADKQRECGLQDPDVVHTEDRVDPVEDLEIIHHELRLKDIERMEVSRCEPASCAVSTGRALPGWTRTQVMHGCPCKCDVVLNSLHADNCRRTWKASAKSGGGRRTRTRRSRSRSRRRFWLY